MERHFPKTKYAADAGQKLKKLNQPIDNEEDPLRLVLAESGFSPGDTESHPRVVVRQAVSRPEPAAESSGYGSDGLPILSPAQPKPAQPALATGAVTLRSIRLAASDPPLSVIFDVSGPVKFEKHLSGGQGNSALTVRLLHTKPDSKLDQHLIFDRSIFKDCDVTSETDTTTVTVNVSEVSRFAIIPLEDPPRLLVTFTPISRELGETANSGL